jgi:ABC-type multidrug transport system fused ATPase/permease subunit
MFSAGTLVANLTLAVVLMVGAHLGVRGVLTAGTVVAFLFLVQLFTGPVQLAAEILNDLHNAVAGWGRVIAIVDTPADVVDARDARQSPRGPAQVSFQGVHFAYPGGADVLHGIDIDLPAQARVAVVGHTGSGKTTLAKLATRLMDPTRGAVLLDGVDLRELAVDSLRRRVVLVPQEGFLFDGTIADNVAYALRTPETPDRSEGLRGHDPHSRETRARLLDVFTTLGLADWLADLPAGLDTPVGQRGESLSAGERQLVAIVRAALAEPDLLVLDEATSAVDPATEVRIARALERLTAHRSTLTIAHRLSTAEASDLVLVVDQGNLVEVGTHTDLVAAGGIYATMHAAWVAQTT